MHIRDDEFHPDLQSQVPGLRRMARLMKIPGFIRLVDWVRRKEMGKDIEGLECSTVNIASSLDGYSIRTRIYRSQRIARVLALPCLFSWRRLRHGSARGLIELIKKFIETRPCVVVAPDYRKAKHRPYPGGFRIATVLCLFGHATTLIVSAVPIN